MREEKEEIEGEREGVKVRDKKTMSKKKNQTCIVLWLLVYRVEEQALKIKYYSLKLSHFKQVFN